MDIESFVQLTLDDSGRNSPIDAAVEEHWELIDASLKAGATLGAIRRLLVEVTPLKCSRSGFNTAVRRVRKRKMRTVTSARGDSRFDSTF
jgi:hypothetical protein